MPSFEQAWRTFLEDWWPHLSPEMRWIVVGAACAVVFAAWYAAFVYGELATVRPMLVFVTVDGSPPPICGFCVLAGQ